MEKVLFAFLVLYVIVRASHDSETEWVYFNPWDPFGMQVAKRPYARSGKRNFCTTARPAAVSSTTKKPDAVSSTTKKPDVVTCNTTGLVTCKRKNNIIRNHYIEQSQCGDPKFVLVRLTPPSAQKHISPSVAWVKRCVGHCDDHILDSKCMPRETMMIAIPIRITDVVTGRESCSSYAVEEHAMCQCCAGREDCRVLENLPSTCTCRCPK